MRKGCIDTTLRNLVLLATVCQKTGYLQIYQSHLTNRKAAILFKQCYLNHQGLIHFHASRDPLPLLRQRRDLLTQLLPLVQSRHI